MFLTRFNAKNFRLLQDFSLDLSVPVTVLIGANNAGKSNVVDALLLLSEAMTRVPPAGFLSQRRGFERVVTGHDKDLVVELGVMGVDNGQAVTYSLSIDELGLVGESASGEGWTYEATRESDGPTWRALLGDGASATEIGEVTPRRIPRCWAILPKSSP
jgi:predicted ATPase